jgi:hypothetical protein
MTVTSRSGWALALALGVCFVPGACSSGSGAPVARFELAGDTPPAFLDVPFPSDVYLANGKVMDPIPGVDALVTRGAQYVTHELGKLNGFGQAEFSFFLVDDPTQPIGEDGHPGPAAIDPASLPIDEDACVADTSSVFLIDLEATDPSKARVRCRAKIHDDSATSDARPVVAVGPGLGVVLEEGHRYAAVLTSRVRDATGAHLVASADFQALLSGSRSGAVATLYGGAIDTVQGAIGDALASDGAQIVAVAPYTTQSTTGEMFKLRESLEQMPVPALAWDAASMAPMGAAKFAALVSGVLPAGFTASLDDWLGVDKKLNDGSDDPDYLNTSVLPHDQIAAIGTAVFQAANFLQYPGGGYADLDYATFARDGSGAIVPNPGQPTMPIWVSFAIPKTPMPANGFPCVIAEHGLPGSRADIFMYLANALTAKGFVVAAIDMITNGARAVHANYRVDQFTDWENAPGATYAGPDGFADNLDGNDQPAVAGATAGPYEMVGLGTNYGAYRDQTRQAEIDVSQLARVLASDPDLSPLQTGATAPRIDATKIAYLGGSFGSIVGGVAAAFEPLIRTWVLNVGGGQLLPSSSSAALNEQRTKPGYLVAFGVNGQFIEPAHPLTSLLQVALDPSDPLVFAPYLVSHPATIDGQPLPPRNVLAIEVLYDQEFGNDGTEAWARAAGIGLAVPNVGPNAGVTTMDEVRDPTKVPDRIPLPDVPPDGSGLIHDTPIAGITAVLVQNSPGSHYRNLEVSSDPRTFPVPFNAETQPLAAPYSVPDSYLQMQATVTRFLQDAFAGNVPNVTGFAPPVRDVDGDGNPDATDPDPNDPTVK